MQNAASRWRSALTWLGGLVPELRDVLAVAGLALLSVGAGMIYRPAGLIVAGVVMLAIGLFGVPRWGS